jgi:TPP-dependent pyruvate/acetoin dehydrogenase alpha subunit
MNELKKFYDEMLLLRLFDQQCMDLKKRISFTPATTLTRVRKLWRWDSAAH